MVGITDAANHETQFGYDPLGRVTEVIFPPTLTESYTYDAMKNLLSKTDRKQQTISYTYDVMGKLLTVAQGSQHRTFTYDSFSRLITAANPETGTITYAYQNADGSSCGGSRSSVCTRTDARGVITSYGYDADNRLLYKNYSDTTTMRACYAYDGQNGWGNPMNNPIGHLTSSFGITHAGAVVSGNESWDWDEMGRLRSQMQCTPATCGSSSGYNVYATYDLLGNQTSIWDSSVAVYPTYDGADRLLKVTAGLNVKAGTPGPGSQTLITITAHSPFGGLTNASLGNGLAETRGYNTRGWLSSIADGSVYSLGLTYYGNGSVSTANDNVNGNWTYNYDALDRISTASMTGQSFTYSPDKYGNMTCTYSGSKPCTPTPLAFSSTTNRITTTGYSYDAAGNLLSDNTHGYVYDGENRITCILGTDGTCTSSTATVYSYDPDGRRVAKNAGTGTVIEEYVYDLKGDQSSAHSGTGAVLRNELYSPDGRHLATWKSSALTYNLADWLGTERVRANSSGAACETSTDTPYGMNMTVSGSCGDPSPMHFTGKQLDSESNNTYFGARYYATNANLARFMTPDWSDDGSPVPYAKLDNPQTLNLYAYLRNNPLNTVDPDGHAGAGQGTFKPCAIADNTCAQDQQNSTSSHPEGRTTTTYGEATITSNEATKTVTISQRNTTTTTDQNGNVSSSTTRVQITVSTDPNKPGAIVPGAGGLQMTSPGINTPADEQAQLGPASYQKLQDAVVHDAGNLGRAITQDAHNHPVFYGTVIAGFLGTYAAIAGEVGDALVSAWHIPEAAHQIKEGVTSNDDNK